MLTEWRSLVLPDMDYVVNSGPYRKNCNIQKLEQLLKSFLRKISGYSQYYYWELLKTQLVSSLERKRERYTIIYKWRMLKDQELNTGIWKEISKRGRTCTFSPLNHPKRWISKLREANFCVRETSVLLNYLHSYDCKTLVFQNALDKWLNTITD